MFQLRSLICDIHRQLMEHQCDHQIRVYRGQRMSPNELECLKKSIRQFISFNSFLSTSSDQQEASMFLEDYNYSDGLLPVLFEIDADPRVVTNKPFANISSLSAFKGESEVLFMIGSIFHLIDIRHCDMRMWIVRMELCGDDKHDMKQLLTHMKKQHRGGDGETDLFSFAILLRRMGKFDLAEKYFHRLLKELPSNHHCLADVYHNIGLLADHKGDYDTSIQWYQKSLERKIRIRPSDYVGIGNTHNCIGTAYGKKGDHNRALASFNKALSLFDEGHYEDHPHIATYYNNIGIIYQEQNKYLEALAAYEKSLCIKQKRLPPNHPDLGTSFHNIGAVHDSLGHNDLALEHYDRALAIRIKSLPSQHIDIASTYENMGLVHEKKREFERALIFFQKAATIYRQTLSGRHHLVVKVEQNIKRVSGKVN
ncbi:unnamed protein product [Rotaria magnacalcarata]